MRLLYFGTPVFAVPPLQALHDAGYELVGVVTQPDSPARRSRDLVPSPVKAAAEQLGIPVFAPPSLKNEATVAALAATRPDLAVVAAYGEILRPALLALPTLGFLNIHPSLLPRHRGPAPVVGTILAGDALAGVTIMQLDAGMDTGPLLAQESLPLPADARAGALTGELFVRGAALLLQVMAPYAAGTLLPVPQDAALATTTRLIRKEHGLIDWARPALEIERMTRAYDPWPGAFTSWHEQPLRVIAATVEHAWQGSEPPGTLLEGPELRVASGAGALTLREVQPAGKRPMDGTAFRRGMQVQGAARLGVTDGAAGDQGRA